MKHYRIKKARAYLGGFNLFIVDTANGNIVYITDCFRDATTARRKFQSGELVAGMVIA